MKRLAHDLMRLTAVLASIFITGSTAAQMAPTTQAQRAIEFTVSSRDGTVIKGQVDLPVGNHRVAVVMVAGTGLFDRDVNFGRSGTEADKLFKELGHRLASRGLAAVRYDRRGVRFGQSASSRLDPAISGTSTLETQQEDLAAVYTWARGKNGNRAKCVILFGHSEGTLHIARLAASGAPEPLGVIGVGALAASPQAVLRWQMSKRDAFSLRAMDVNRDGKTTAAEVDAHWRETPSSAFDMLAPFLPPDGEAWTDKDITQVEVVQDRIYEQARLAALKLDDSAPYPNLVTPMARSSWWKSWFTDDIPAAKLLAKWQHTPIYFHWGSIDSQTPPSLNERVAREWLGRRAILAVHPGLGHSLGAHALYAPIDSRVADEIADQAASLARKCS